MIGAFGAGAAIFMIVWRDVHFAADDGFYAMGGGLMIEICGGEEIAVVGYGDCGHAAAGGFCGEFADFAGAVQQRVVRVQMKVNEVRGIHAKFILNQSQVARNSNLRWFLSRGCVMARFTANGVIFSPGAASISFQRLCHHVQPCRVWLVLLHRWPLLRIVRAWLSRQELCRRAQFCRLARLPWICPAALLPRAERFPGRPYASF